MAYGVLSILGIRSQERRVHYSPYARLNLASDAKILHELRMLVDEKAFGYVGSEPK